jgi:hypothetical protein
MRITSDAGALSRPLKRPDRAGVGLRHRCVLRSPTSGARGQDRPKDRVGVAGRHRDRFEHSTYSARRAGTECLVSWATKRMPESPPSSLNRRSGRSWLKSSHESNPSYPQVSDYPLDSAHTRIKSAVITFFCPSCFSGFSRHCETHTTEQKPTPRRCGRPWRAGLG